MGDSICRTRSLTHCAIYALGSYIDLQFRKMRPPFTSTLETITSLCLHSTSTPSTCSQLPLSSLFSPSSLSVSFPPPLPYPLTFGLIGATIPVSLALASPLPQVFENDTTPVSVIVSVPREALYVYARQEEQEGGQKVRVPPHRACASNLMTCKKIAERDTQDLEARVCPPKGCS